MTRQNRDPVGGDDRASGNIQADKLNSRNNPSPSPGQQKALPEQRALVLSHAGKLPSTYMAAKRALAECERVDQCKEWADQAKALASYAAQAKDTSLLDSATRIKAQATRRMGELLREIDAKGKRTDKQPAEGDHGKLSQREAAARAGLSEHQQLQAVRVANVPDDEFEQLVDGSNPPTVTKLAEIGTKHKPAPAPKPKRRSVSERGHTILKRPTKSKSGPVFSASGIWAARQDYLRCAELVADAKAERKIINEAFDEIDRKRALDRSAGTGGR